QESKHGYPFGVSSFHSVTPLDGFAGGITHRLFRERWNKLSNMTNPTLDGTQFPISSTISDTISQGAGSPCVAPQIAPGPTVVYHNRL
ncbi:MAG TPA: hypothetical protein PK205_17125, partial [Promineifilum sp.]|nr:hypothetical protein [Promineifilum sp.]HRQ15027.1 hypothetical protein [Promineifilum sp.]